MSRLYVGQEIREERVFTTYDVEHFAQISGDCNPIHLDEEYGRRSRFGGTVVHGLLVSGLISKIIGMDMPGEGSIYMEQNLRFRKPVYVGEKVVAKIKIADIDKDRNIYTLETNVYNSKEECVIEGNAKVLYEG